MTQSNPENYAEFDPKDLESIQLIDDEREYKEQKIDRRLAWLGENDSTSRLKTLEMVEADAEMRYFQTRKHELELEREKKMHQRATQYEREINRIQTTPPPVSLVGREYEVTARRKASIEQEISKRGEVCKREVNLIAGRYNSSIFYSQI